MLKRFEQLVRFLLTASLLIALAGWLAQYHWFPALFRHFLLQQIVFAILILACCLSLRIQAPARILSLLFLVLLQAREAHIQELLFPLQPASGQSIRVLQYNLKADRALASLDEMDWMKQSEADVVLLQEFTPEYARMAQELQEDYPHVLALEDSGRFGLAIYSKLPLQSTKTHWIEAVPLQQVMLQKEGQRLTLFHIHPPPGFGSDLNRLRQKTYEWLQTAIDKLSMPVIVAGDFNDSPFSPSLMEFESEAKLVNLQRGLGYRLTWKGLGSWMGLSIDHVLLRGMAPASLATGPDFGSDHLPVLSEAVFLKDND